MDQGRLYGDFITKFFRLDGLPIFITHGASLARFARWSSANERLMIKNDNKNDVGMYYDVMNTWNSWIELRIETV